MSLTELREAAELAVRKAARLQLDTRWGYPVLAELANALNITTWNEHPRIDMNTNLLEYTPAKFEEALRIAVVAVLRWQGEALKQQSPTERKVYVHPQEHRWCNGKGCYHCNYKGWIHG